MWCTAVVDSFQGLCVPDTADLQLQIPAHLKYELFQQQLHTHVFAHSSFARLSGEAHTQGLKGLPHFLRRSCYQGPTLGGRGLAHNQNEIRERERENNGRYLLCPSLTPWSDHSTAVFSYCNLIYYLNSISRWSREQCRSD